MKLYPYVSGSYTIIQDKHYHIPSHLIVSELSNYLPANFVHDRLGPLNVKERQPNTICVKKFGFEIKNH